MKTIPFDIKLRKDIQSEENGYKGRYKVQTREGEPVRIICWDKKDFKYPIIALVENTSYSKETVLVFNNETIFIFRNDGKRYPNGCEPGLDLCLVDTFEPKFKIGDKVTYKGTDSIYTITSIKDNGYALSNGGFILFKSQDKFELIPEDSKLTDFEKELANCLYKSIGVVCMDGMEILAKEFAPKLLELAKKEIIEKLKEE